MKATTTQKTEELIQTLTNNGITHNVNYSISKSKTNYGESNYFKFYDSDFRQILKIRVSDHSVLSNTRIKDEYHYDLLLLADEKNLSNQGLKEIINVINSWL